MTEIDKLKRQRAMLDAAIASLEKREQAEGNPNGRIKELRKSKRYTQEEVAFFCGCHPKSYTRIENGGSLTHAMAYKLAKLYDVSIDYILYGSEEAIS